MTKLQVIAEWYSFIVFAVGCIGIFANLKDNEFKKDDIAPSSFMIFGFLLYLNIFLSRWFG